MTKTKIFADIQNNNTKDANLYVQIKYEMEKYKNVERKREKRDFLN